MAIDYLIVVSFFFASLLGSVSLLLFNRKGRKDHSRVAVSNSNIEQNKAADPSCCGAGADAKEAEVVIVGAGVAGAALAYTLGKEGRRVHVIERDLSEPDRIVGEFLQPRGYLKLIELGLEDCLENIDAQKAFGYEVYKDGKHTRLSFPLEKFNSDVAGRSFHNGRFIQKMREKASSLPNVRLEQGVVTSLLEDNGAIKGVQYKSTTGQELKVYAPLTIVCDGCFSNLRRSLCEPKVDIASHFVGLVLENCQLPEPKHLHAIIADPSLVLFYPISSTEVRCLVDVPGQKMPSIAKGEMAAYLMTAVAPQVPPKFYDAFIKAVENGNIRTMPTRSMPAAPKPTPGALLLGDSFNMRHPFTGGGMTVALSDVVLLRNLLRPLHDLNDVSFLCRYLESLYTLRKPIAFTINALADVVYQLARSPHDEVSKELRQATFDYVSLGGVFSEGFVGLLSGLNPRPLSAVAHVSAMVIFCACRILLPYPSPARLWIGARIIWGAAGLVLPILKSEGVRQTFFPATIPAYYRAARVQ